jgi:glycosyltransferase involved in cell wall biosynthesis
MVALLHTLENSRVTIIMKKALFITYVFPPIAYAGTYRTLRFIRYLSENGWMPIVVTIKSDDDLFIDDALLNKVPHSVKVHRTSTIDFWRWKNRKNKSKANVNKHESGSSNNGVVNTNRICILKSLKSLIKFFLNEMMTTPDHMVFWSPFAFTKSITLLRTKNIEIIYTSSPPHSGHLPGYFLSKLFKKPWVADFRDPMLDSSGYNPASRYRRWVDRALERLIVHNAHRILIISDHYKKIIEERYPSSASKFITMPNGYDPEDFSGVEPEKFEKFTILYAGTFYANRTPGFFLKSLGLWLGRQSQEVRWSTQVLFYGIMPQEVKDQIREEGLEDIVSTPGTIPKDRLVPKLKGADILLLVIGFDDESRGTVTSKVFEYMASQRPILAIIPEGDAADILSQYDKAHVITSEDHTAVSDCLSMVHAHFATERVGQNGDQHTQSLDCETSVFDARKQTKFLSNIFNALID